MAEKQKNVRKYIPAVHESIDNYLAAIRYLTEHKIPFSDKTPFGGALWVFITDPESKQIADLATTSGLKFCFSQKGGAASHNNPAWYYRASGEKKKKEQETPTSEDFVLKQPEYPLKDRHITNQKWVWQSVDENRVRNALKIAKDLVHLDGEKAEASIESSPDRKTGEIITHVVTLARCSCQDFNVNNHGEKPCKHIIRLGMELGIINENGLTPEQQREKDIIELRDKIARASGYYHVFHSPICTDNTYDRMKERLTYLETMMS